MGNGTNGKVSTYKVADSGNFTLAIWMSGGKRLRWERRG